MKFGLGCVQPWPPHPQRALLTRCRSCLLACSELAPVSWRGRLVACLQMAVNVGEGAGDGGQGQVRRMKAGLRWNPSYCPQSSCHVRLVKRFFQHLFLYLNIARAQGSNGSASSSSNTSG